MDAYKFRQNIRKKCIYFLSSLFINYKMYVHLIFLEQDTIEKLLQ